MQSVGLYLLSFYCFGEQRKGLDGEGADGAMPPPPEFLG